MRLIVAARKDAGCSELQDEDGRSIAVERDPEPGIAIRLTRRDAEDDASDWYALSVRPTEQRPDLYPATVPFIPARSATIVSSTQGIMATWRLIEAPACGIMPGLKQSPAVERMQETVKPIADRVRAGDKSAREELTAKLRELTTSLSPSGLAAIFKAAQPDAESLAELNHMFDAARQSSIGDGWAVVEEEQSASPMPMQKIVLEKGNESRRLVMIATAGPGAVVFLSQQPKAAAD